MRTKYCEQIGVDRKTANNENSTLMQVRQICNGLIIFRIKDNHYWHIEKYVLCG
jgi:hypothetical protein